MTSALQRGRQELALVPHSHGSALTNPLILPERTISFGTKTFVLEQAWEPDGVGGTALGFGASVYPAAIVLGTWIHDCVMYGSAVHMDIASRLQSGVVVEIGCGTGLVGIAAAAAGAPAVLLTDGDSVLLHGLTQNNLLRARAGLLSYPAILPWKWGHAQHWRSVLAHCEIHGGASVIVAADVVAVPYAPALVDLLQDLVKACAQLSRYPEDERPRSSPPVLLAYTRRHYSEDVWWEYAAQVFEIQELDVASACPDLQKQVRLVRLDWTGQVLPLQEVEKLRAALAA